MAAYATVADVENRLGETIPNEELGQVVTLLGDAEAVLTAMVGDLAMRITNGKTSAANIATVAANMVVRVLHNPQGLRQETYPEYALVRDTRISAGGMFLTREDRRLMGIRAGAMSVPVSDAALPHLIRRPDYYWPAVPPL